MTALARVGFDVRHALRLQRFELTLFTVLVAFAAAAAIGVAGVLDTTGFGTACSPYLENPPSCEDLGAGFWSLQNSGVAQVLRPLLIALPFLVGAIAGVPIVARELERGTARLAWSLAPSRWRWFVARVLPVLGAVIVLSLACGLAASRLAGAVNPWTDAWPSFSDFGLRGLGLAARAVFVFAIAVACGAVIGRSLPGLLVAIVVGSILISGGSWAHGRWMATEAVYVEDDETGLATAGALYLDQRLREDATGRILDWDALYAEHPELQDSEEWPPAGWSYVALVVPRGQAPFLEAREAAALGLASLSALAIAGVAVTRRRPG